MPRWYRILLACGIAFALVMGACASRTDFDCSIWTPDDPDLQAKRDYCFPDCPSCGPAFRGPRRD